MKLPQFELHRPTSIGEATSLLGRYGDEAAVYCGGTELLLLMKLGLAEPQYLVDVKAIDELRSLEVDDGRLTIGAAVTHREIELSPTVRDGWPALADMERRVANIRVRNAGTLGGNLCFSDPHSDPATFLLAADAEVVLRRGEDGCRSLPIGEFVRGAYETAVEPGELLASVRIPTVAPGAVLVHEKLAFHERPAATVTCFVRIAHGRVAEARIAVGSVGVVPVRATEAESILTGAPNDEAIEAAGQAAAEAAAPVVDANGSVEYKKNLVRVLIGRAFRDAMSKAT